MEYHVKVNFDGNCVCGFFIPIFASGGTVCGRIVERHGCKLNGKETAHFLLPLRMHAALYSVNNFLIAFD